MDTVSSFISKPKGILKLLYKLPVYLYKWHVGWILGRRFLMITHIGRKSGKKHQTVLEVIHYDPSTQEFIVISGYGEKSDWYKNIVKTPVVEVQVKGTRFVPKQRILSPEETFTLFDTYRKEHPLAFKAIISGMGYPYNGTSESLLTICKFIRGISFTLQKSI
ncbi:MAG TPA: nitroreductase family deazaflavin-dependent oxidoreductase [Candidatus Saccharimonadales bacterium]|nr:nitroreductase family deazaflavin-dependent oxidoreductase [Candidatus Saccharimonadales bacterium]